ncbi:MAG: VOC family protein [Marinobacter sp.]|uniref:VOC family protein n=1 Tax=Marinobacter sp. TaxID=50741 RepID=UPI00299D6A06|nr:VOC family protein [Marinobacter sp.]MDX1756003.1 VOC family protein [Marinobacter sp.]
MITNVIVGTNDLERAEHFYDALLARFDARQVMKTARSILWKSEGDGVGLAVCVPFDEQPAGPGNGSMIGLRARSQVHLISVYETALALGGSSEGEPGERRPGVMAAYFRDLDQNKFGVFYLE